MTASNRITRNCAIAFAMMCPGAVLAADAPAGQMLFVSGAVKIVNESGVERIAKKGDMVGPGDRVVTGGGAIGQIKMPDGSLVGVRADSDLKFDRPKPADGKDPAERVVFLGKGAVRIVNVEGGKNKPLPLLLQTPTATIGLRNADNESIVVAPRAAGGPTPPADPGTYSRMTVGSGVLKTTSGETPLAPSQTGFAAIGSTTLPTKIAALPDMAISINPPTPSAGTSGPVAGSTLTGGNPVTGPIAMAPLPGGDTIKLPPPVLTASVLTPLVVTTTSIKMPVLPPTLVGANLDLTNVPPVKIATLPNSILKDLSPATLAPVIPFLAQDKATALSSSLSVSTVSALLPMLTPTSAATVSSSLPTSTISQLSTATLNTLPPATLATLPLDTIKSLSPTVQSNVTPLLTTTQITTLSTTVAAPVKTFAVVPATTTVTLKTAIIR